MFIDFVLTDNNKDMEPFAKKLGFSNIYYQNEFSKLGIVFASSDYSENRKLVESGKIKILVNPHVNTHKDSLHFRAGGLDHILTRLCKEKNVAIGFSLSTLDNSLMIGRIRQNIQLCRKYKVKMLFFSFASNQFELRSANDILSLLRILGMTGKEAKDALNFTTL